MYVATGAEERDPLKTLSTKYVSFIPLTEVLVKAFDATSRMFVPGTTVNPRLAVPDTTLFPLTPDVPRVTVHAVPLPVTDAIVGVPVIPAPLLIEKFDETTPVTDSLNVTRNCGADTNLVVAD